MSAEDRDARFHTQPIRFEDPLDYGDSTSMQMFSAVVGGACSSSHTVTLLVLPGLLEDMEHQLV